MENVNLLVATKELEFPEYEIFKLDLKRFRKIVYTVCIRWKISSIEYYPPNASEYCIIIKIGHM